MTGTVPLMSMSLGHILSILPVAFKSYQRLSVALLVFSYPFHLTSHLFFPKSRSLQHDSSCFSTADLGLCDDGTNTVWMSDEFEHALERYESGIQ